MKRRIYVLVFGLFIVSQIHAQTADTLTNNSIIKMSKARLSDELIIEVIRSSPVKFNLSASSMTSLLEQNVSNRIVDAMKLADVNQNASKVNLSSSSQKTLKEEAAPEVILPVTLSQESRIKVLKGQIESKNLMGEENMVSVAIGYVVPMKHLVTFYENEFDKLSETMAEWDRSINDLTDALRQSKDKIIKTENELSIKKNADSKGFSDDILGMKKNLTDYRENYSKAKAEMLKQGESITKKLEKMSSDKVNAVTNLYNEVSQDIKSADSDPSKDQISESVTFKNLKVNNNSTDYIAPASEMLVWHLNEIKGIGEVIKKWDTKINEIIIRDAKLNEQLEPLIGKMEEYKTDTKRYKTEISELKKQISSLEKQRKEVANQMKDDSRELAGNIKQNREEIQKNLEQRFIDIIENINYFFQEN